MFFDLNILCISTRYQHSPIKPSNKYTENKVILPVYARRYVYNLKNVVYGCIETALTLIKTPTYLSVLIKRKAKNI